MKKIISKIKKMGKRKSVILVCSLSILLLLCVGVTYSWFGAITEGEGNRISIKSKELKLIYTDPLVVNASSIEPGWKLTKTFTVENTTDEEKYYKIVWSDLIPAPTSCLKSWRQPPAAQRRYPGWQCSGCRKWCCWW